MKTIFGETQCRMRDTGPLRPLSAVLCLLSSVLCLPPGAWAEIPEPDNVVFGRIEIGTNFVTTQRSNVVVEVRHSGDTNVASSNVLASYRLGQDPALGESYAVEIPFWSPENTVPLLPSPTDSNLVIVVKETVIIAQQAHSYLRYRTNVVVGLRGHVVQIDFGNLPAESGLEAWMTQYGLTDGNEDLDGDGSSNLDEYLAGTMPTNPDSCFTLGIRRGGGGLEISFLTYPATGPLYSGLTRYYSLLGADNPQSGPWTGVGSFTNILGSGGPHTFVLATTNARPRFYRGKVELR